MYLYLVRHAIAFERNAERWPDDGERPLTRAGKEKLEQTCRGLRVLVPEVNVVLSSPLVRAWHTAKILERRAGWSEPRRCDVLGQGHSADEVLQALQEYAVEPAIAVVGHAPGLGELLSLLLLGDAHVFDVGLKKGGVTCVSLDPLLRAGSGRLRWLLPPKLLRAIGSEAIG